MNIRRKAPFLVIIAIITYLLTGCWNYKEVEQLAIVSGVAIDKDGKDKMLITVEIANVKQEQKQSTLKPVYIQAVGFTFFDAIRSMIAFEGRRLYWSHAKVAIISEEIAKDSITKALDFIYRDAEVREDMWILISREPAAREVYKSQSEVEDILSFQIDNTMRAQKSISRFPTVTLYEFLESVGSAGTSTTVPTVKIIENRGKFVSYVTGAAIIKEDKLLGYLNEIETRSLLWIQDKLQGGIYPVRNVADTAINTSLEIFKSKTKVKPEIKDGVLCFNINIETEVSIGEIMGDADFISEKGRLLLEETAEAQIKKDIEAVLEKATKQYKNDFLGFGNILKRHMPSAWKSVEKEWSEIFPTIDTNVSVDIRIRGSATKSKPLKVGK